MRFEIVGRGESYGKHRFSNNAILDALADASAPSEDLLFVWWIEKMFLDPRYERIVERMCETDWFGVMHVPLTTPNWAMYSQNNMARLHFDPRWRQALTRCRGIVALSDHLAQQVRAIYPDVRVASVLHPISAAPKVFDAVAFRADPKLTLVGTWLRDFDGFLTLDAPFAKKVVFNQYGADFLRMRYGKYRPMILDAIRSLDHLEFLENDAYDALITSSVLYLGLHDTSANNAVCECVAYRVPFVARRHPAIEEYCGEDYPLFVEDDDAVADLTVEDALAAHRYLARNEPLREALSMERFVEAMRRVWASL